MLEEYIQKMQGIFIQSIFNLKSNNISNPTFMIAIFSFIAYLILFVYQLMNKWIVGSIEVGGLLLLHIFYLYKVLNYMNYI